MDPIDRELALLLSVEPSPEFRARVRTRIANEPAPRSWYLQWRAAGTALAAFAVAAAVVLGRADRPDRAAHLSSTALSPFPLAIPGPPAVGAAISGPTPRREPEVLVAPSEIRGLRQLDALVREGRTQFIFMDEDVLQRPVKDIIIEPITIAPIEIAALSVADEHSEGDEP